MSLSYLFRLGRTTISDIVCEVCSAICSMQQEYMKVLENMLCITRSVLGKGRIRVSLGSRLPWYRKSAYGHMAYVLLS